MNEPQEVLKAWMFVSETGAKVKRKVLSLNFTQSEETSVSCAKRNTASLRASS